MVKIKKAEYIFNDTELLTTSDNMINILESFPEMCLAGRSNVGKSSFINAMLSRNGLAKVSSTPGKTRTLNFFNVNDALYFVDVPGYGYAKVANNVTKQFGKTMDEYISERQTLRGFILLVDYRHKPTEDDCLMYDFLKYYNLKIKIVATKYDKVSKNSREKQNKLIKDTLKLPKDEEFIPFSTVYKTGKEEVYEAIKEFI